MQNPKDILTDRGYEDWCADINYLDRILFKIENNVDDMEVPEEIMSHVYKLQESMEMLKHGSV